MQDEDDIVVTMDNPKESWESLFDEAIELLKGDRRKDYGNPYEMNKRVAATWGGYLDCEVEPTDVAAMMILFKIARNKQKYKRDNPRDIIGYVAVGEMVREKEAVVKANEKMEKNIMQWRGEI